MCSTLYVLSPSSFFLFSSLMEKERVGVRRGDGEGSPCLRPIGSFPPPPALAYISFEITDGSLG